MMGMHSTSRSQVIGRNDPRRLRELMDRVVSLAAEHGVRSVVVGVAGRDGDPLIAEFTDYVESALRMEDAIFRMTRERSVLFLTDVDRGRAEGIVTRLVDAFAQQVSASRSPVVRLGFAEIPPGPNPPLLRDVLLEAFPARS